MPPLIPVAPLLAAPPTIRQVLAGEAAWRVPLVGAEITLPDGVRDLALSGLPLRDACEALRAVRGTKNGQEFDVHIVASTAKIARDNGVIPIEAWREDLHLFQANPAILWQHNSSLGPIGRAVAVELRATNRAEHVSTKGRMLQWWRFNDATEQSQTAHALFAMGDMRAASVGWIIRAFHRVDEDELKKLTKSFPEANEWTWVVDRAELLETSAVSVGADPGALSLNAGEAELRAAFDELGERYAYGRTYKTDKLYAQALAARCATGDGDACKVLVDGFADHKQDEADSDQEAVEVATASLGAAMGTDEGVDAWRDAHRDLLGRLGDGCVTRGAEIVVAESIRRTLKAHAIQVDGLSMDEVRAFIVGQLARVIGTEAREAHNRLKEQGRT